MSHRAVIMVPVIIDLQSQDKRVALQEARDEVARYERYDTADSADKVFSARLLAFYEDLEIRDRPPPPMAA